jgi:hypothetical protein
MVELWRWVMVTSKRLDIHRRVSARGPVAQRLGG